MSARAPSLEMTARTGIERRLKSDFAVVAHAARLAFLERVHDDGIGPRLHHENVFVAHIALELHPVHEVRKGCRWHILGSRGRASERDIADFAECRTRDQQREHR